MTGDPAQGKSVLAAYLVNACKDKYGDCLFFFCRHDNDAKRSVSKILRTIAFHLAEMENVVRDTYLARKRQGISLTNMPYGMLWERLFTDCLPSKLSRTVHLVIDGFDELSDDDRQEFASLLLDVTKFNIRLLVIGRRDGVAEVLEDGDSRVKQIKINRRRTNRDIRKVVAARVEKKLSALSEQSKQVVVSTLTKKAGGLFLWAKLALEIVCKKRLESAIFKALDDLPMGLKMKSMYSMIAERISTECSDDDEKRLVKALFTWTFCSFRPLSVSELKFAIEMKFGSLINFEKTIRDLSGSLIEVGEDGDVTVVHATVKEFFMSEDAGEFRIVEEIGNKSVACICLGYLSGKVGDLPNYLHFREDSSPEPERLRLSYPLLEYASQYLFSHFQLSHPSDTLTTDILTFLEDGRSLTWIEALGAFGLVDELLTAASTMENIHKNENISEKNKRKAAQVTIDLSRIALQIEEKVTKHPRAIHVSLSSMFPSACAVGRRSRHDYARCIQPKLFNWPAWRAFRGGDQIPTDTKVSTCFTPCGGYLVFGQIPTTLGPVSIIVYQTKTYQPIIKFDPFSHQETRGGMEGGFRLDLNICFLKFDAVH